MNTFRLVGTMAMLAAVTVSCVEEYPVNQATKKQVAYKVSMEEMSSKTKTSLTDDCDVIWSEGDRIKIFAGSDSGRAFEIVDGFAGKTSAEFTAVEGVFTEGSGAEFDATVACYPYDEDVKIEYVDYETCSISNVSFPSEQLWHEDSFGTGAAPMVAFRMGMEYDLQFMNVGGLVRFALTGEKAVSRITLKGHNGELLSGEGMVTVGSYVTPTIDMGEDASSEVSLVCDPAVQLNVVAPEAFYISVPPVEFEKGFALEIEYSDGEVETVSTDKYNEVRRSSVLWMPSVGERVPEDTFATVNDIDGWTETRFGADGTIVFIKEDDMGRMTNALMFLPDEENIYLPAYMKFDANGVPTYMQFADTEVYIDGYTDSTVDFTVAVEDAVWSIRDVPCEDLALYTPLTKAWSDNNSIRNACAIAEVIVGAASVAGGVVLISASGVGAVLTGGAAVPVSVAGIGLGVMNIYGGCTSIVSGLETIFGPAEQEESTYLKDSLVGIGLEKISDWCQKPEEYNLCKKFIPANLLKEAADVGKLGTLSFWAGLAFGSVDELLGETYTDRTTMARAHQDILMISFNAEDVTSHSATISGYVAPEAVTPFGTKVSNEVFIVLWEYDNYETRVYKSVVDGDGGKVSFNFSDLKPDTKYVHKVIFYDKEWGYSRESALNFFWTSAEEDSVWVDLGLSVLWADRNVGAKSPEECGGYYAWGEIEEKQIYAYETYRYATYELLWPGEGDIPDRWVWMVRDMNKNICGSMYDVANVVWGDGARMPTHEEILELFDKCCLDASREGLELYSEETDNSIYLPYAGMKWDGDQSYYEEGCFLWSGTPEESCGDEYVLPMAFDYYIDVRGLHSFSRYSSLCPAIGVPVRPVKDK